MSAEIDATYMPPPPPPPPPHRTKLGGLPAHERYLQGVLNPTIPSDDESPTRCPLCLKWGHLDDTCPQRACEHCGARDAHPSLTCPQKPRCTSCGRLGHSAESCTGELMSSVTLVCSLCHNVGHLEDKCTSWFRRYQAENDDRMIPMPNWKLTIGCYQCGSKQHFGGDCPKFPKRQRGPFSAEYVSKFVEQKLAVAIDDVRPGQANTVRQLERDILKPKGRLGKKMKKFNEHFLLDQEPQPSAALPALTAQSFIPPPQPPTQPKGNKNTKWKGNKGATGSTKPEYTPGPRVPSNTSFPTHRADTYRPQQVQQQQKEQMRRHPKANKQAKRNKQPQLDRVVPGPSGDSAGMSIGNHQWALPERPSRADAFMGINNQYDHYSPPQRRYSMADDADNSRYHISKRQRR